MIPALKPWCLASWMTSLNIWPHQTGNNLIPLFFLKPGTICRYFPPECLNWRISSWEGPTPCSCPVGRSWQWIRNLNIVVLQDPVSEVTKSVDQGQGVEIERSGQVCLQCWFCGPRFSSLPHSQFMLLSQYVILGNCRKPVWIIQVSAPGFSL